MNCAYCHDELDVAATCVECQTALHFECWEEDPRCPTLGCEIEVKRAPWAGVTSFLGFLLLCFSITGKTNPVLGDIHIWECPGIVSYFPKEPEADPVLTKAPPPLTDPFQDYLDETAWVIRDAMDRSPRHGDTSEGLELTECRRRVVGRRKDEEVEPLPLGLLMRPDQSRPGEFRGGVTW
ncbi:MAG: hypothetical protein P1V97_01350 [Planctomycetota bacterium]|nr:hypothetical protein [Planctomycetota bacterium]